MPIYENSDGEHYETAAQYWGREALAALFALVIFATIAYGAYLVAVKNGLIILAR